MDSRTKENPNGSAGVFTLSNLGLGGEDTPVVESQKSKPSNGKQVQANNQNVFTLDNLKKKDTSSGSELPSTPQSELPAGSVSREANGNMFSFDNFNKQTDNTVTTADGVKFNLKGLPVPQEVLPTIVNNIQQRINTKTATPDDIQTIADYSGKSPQAVQAYINKGQLAGSAVENTEDVAKTQAQLVTYINNYNKINGTDYDPQQVMSSADSLNNFLNESKKENAQLTKEVRVGGKLDLSKPLSPKQQEQFAFLNYGVMPIRNEMLNQVVQKTVSELPKDQAIDKIAKVLNPEDYKKVQDIQNQGLTVKDYLTNTPTPLSIFQSDNKEQNDLLNYQKGISELKYNEALQKNAVNKVSQGVVSGDQNLVQQGQTDLAQVDNDVVYKYPALLKQQIAQQVNDYIAKKSGVVKGYDATAINDYKEKVFGSSTQDRLDAMKALGILDDPKKKDIAESMAGNSTYFANNSILGSVVPNLLQPLGDLGMSLEDITGLRNQRDIFSDKLKEQLFPKDFSGNNPNDANSLQLKNSVQYSRNILNTTANLAGMLAVASVTEGLGTEAGLSTKVAQQLGAYTSFGLPAFDQSLKNAPESIESEPAKYLYAAINSIANAEGGIVLDLGKITRIPDVDEAFAKVANGLSNETMTENVLKETLDKAKNKYIDFAMKYGKNVTKGAATMAYFNIANNVIKMAFGDKEAQQNLIPEAGHAFLDGVLGMSIMGGFGAVADMKNEKNTSFKGTIYNMALNHDAAADVFKMGLDNGTYTKQQYDEKMQILNTARAAKNALDATSQETNTPLDANQKSVYVANRTAQSVLTHKAEQDGLPEETKNKYLAQAKRLSEQNQQVLEGLKFSGTLEPLYDLFDAEKNYNQALENYNPADKKSSDELEKAKGNYDQLYSDYLKNNSQPSTQIKTNTNGESKKSSTEENVQKQNGEQQNGQNDGQENDVQKEVTQKGAGDKTAPLIENQPTKEELVKRVEDKGVNGYKKTSIEEVGQQALQAPNSLKNQLGDENLVTDLIAHHSEKDINDAIKYQEGRLGNNPSDQDITDIDNHIQLLEKGLEKKQKYSTEKAPEEKQPNISVDKKIREKNADMLRDLLDESSTDKESSPLTFDQKDNIHKAINDYEDGKIEGEQVKEVMLNNGLTEDFISRNLSEKLFNERGQNLLEQSKTENINKPTSTEKPIEGKQLNTDKPITEQGNARSKGESVTPLSSEGSSGKKTEGAKDVDIFDELSKADKSKKSLREKKAAVEKAAKEFGDEGKKAAYIHNNFDKIVQKLKENNKIEVKCP